MGGPRDAARLTLDDIEAVVREVPGIQVWDPMQVKPDVSVRRGDRSTPVRLMGLSERSERAWNRGATRGAYLDAGHVAASSRVAVIGETVVRALFPDRDPIGDEIQIGSVPFRVLGVLESFGTDIHGMDRDAEIVIPITTAMRRVMNVDSLRGAKLVLGSPEDLESAAAGVVRVLRERHRLLAGQPDDFTVISSLAVRKVVARSERILFLYLPLGTAACFLAALLVAASLMLASVTARTGEIGLRRAVGARAEDIRLQFLLEAAATTLMGGLLGALVGGVAARMAADRFAGGVDLAPGPIALGLGLSIATGLVAGLLPARRAARLPPADALR
jgi:putative ABC transport system permease protein